MEHPGFFENKGPFSLAKIAEVTGAQLSDEADAEKLVEDIRPLDTAGANHISFLDNAKYVSQFENTKAAACFVSAKFADKAPEGLTVLISEQPYHCFAKTLGLFYTEARFSQTATGEGYNGSLVHPSAELEEDVIVEPGAVIGPEVKIGKGARISAGAVIGYRVYIGRECYIGPNANILHTLVGDRVIVHSGACVGQDGFGFAMGAGGHLKVPQIGRVVLQDDVEIGANATIDRGALSDTIIGQGTKVDNLVQVAHNVVTGNHCMLVAQTGISGSTELGDYVVLAGQVGVVGHIKIETGVQVGAKSAVTKSLSTPGQWGGIPAQPINQWRKSVATLRRLTSKPQSSAGKE